jgi:Peptidase propeptide and YPEB domain
MRIQHWIVAVVVALGLIAGSQAWAKPQAAQAKQKPPAAAAKKAPEKAEDEEQSEQNVKLPAAVEAAFKKAYPTATIKGTSKEDENGKTVYEIESIDKGLGRDLLYQPDGTVISIEEEIPESAQPAAVTATLKKQFAGATITKREKVTEGGTMFYEFQLTGAKVPEVQIRPDGTVIPPETPEKEPVKKEPVKK